jgi:cell division protein ZapB
MDSSKNRVLPLLLLFLLLGSIGLNFYFYKQNKATIETDTVKMDSLVEVRVEISSELAQTSLDLNKYKGLSEKMDSLLLAANGQIAERESRIRKLIATEKDLVALNKKLKVELEELKTLKDSYLESIDQLLKENSQLKYENKALNNSLNEVITENLDLFKKVKTAENLKAEYLKVGIFKRKSNGKYIETVMAKRTNKLEVCFSILENKVAQVGGKNVYLRIITPDGLPLGSRSGGSGSFKLAGSNEEVLFTAMQEVDYANDKVDICLPFEEQDRVFASGTYIVEVYVEGVPAAASSFTLK